MELASAPSTIPAPPPNFSEIPLEMLASCRETLYSSACAYAEQGQLVEAWVRDLGERLPAVFASMPERELFAIVAVAWGIGTV